MNALYTAEIATAFGVKSIAVMAEDILKFSEPIDILTTSAFYGGYEPTPKTLFHALDEAGICVEALAAEPYIDLRDICNVWLSKEITASKTKIGRLGCVEMSPYRRDRSGALGNEERMLNAIRAYFKMLDIASLAGVKMQTVALPLLGAGSQHISGALTVTPILNECISFLKRNASVERILFIEKNQQNAFLLADVLNRSYAMASAKEERAAVTAKGEARAFISYSSPDRNIADSLCAKLEARGVRVWYAPRNVRGDYASSILDGIKDATHFIVILSENSMRSQHVLNEIDHAFRYLPDRIRFKPLRIDEQLLTPAFDYYLSRQHWMDASLPPLEERLNEFADSIAKEV